MALQTVYQQFLASPSSSSLTDDAAIYYITTTTAVHGASEIIKHFSSQRQQISKKRETLLSAVESNNSLAVEIDTTILFLTGGSVYLPGLDDNFLTDHVVYLPIVHFVSFNAGGKIIQIRQCWDQGALLKQIDVIGKSGRNWPIFDSAEQTKLIASALNSVKKELAAVAAPASILPHRSHENSKNTSLELFATREDPGIASVVSPYGGVRPRQRDIIEILNEDPETTPGTVISPYAGRRPRQRSLTEILGRGGEEEEGDGSATCANSSVSSSSARIRSRSPSKVIPPKAGVSKKFQPSRFFETDGLAAAEEEPDSPGHPGKPKPSSRPNPQRFSHFDLASGSQDAPQAGTSFDALPKSKHDSQWAFSDFETPQKLAVRTLHGQEVRHWTLDNEDLPETPSATSRAESQAAGRQRGAAHNEGLGLYENNLYKEDGSAFTPGPEARALGNITNLKDRMKFFAANFTMSDVSPQSYDPAKHAVVADDRRKVVKMMESSWTTALNDTASSQKENIPGTNVIVKDSSDNRGIQIGGDGMGGKKSGRGWSIGEEDGEKPDLPRTAPGKKQGTAKEASSFWDY